MHSLSNRLSVASCSRQTMSSSFNERTASLSLSMCDSIIPFSLLLPCLDVTGRSRVGSGIVAGVTVGLLRAVAWIRLGGRRRTPFALCRRRFGAPLHRHLPGGSVPPRNASSVPRRTSTAPNYRCSATRRGEESTNLSGSGLVLTLLGLHAALLSGGQRYCLIELSLRQNFANWFSVGAVLRGWVRSASCNTTQEANNLLSAHKQNEVMSLANDLAVPLTETYNKDRKRF
jgi:hypothetical protein